MRICVVDYGIGNIESVVNACLEIDDDTKVVDDGASLRAARPERVILPGVGAVGAALNNLRDRGLDNALHQTVVEEQVPFLGICVGMQVLGETCEEFGTHQGLGWIPGSVERLAPETSGMRLPHVGWNTVESARTDDVLMRGISGKDAYFVHSYALHCPDEYALAHTSYGGRSFVSAVRHEHVAGVQFHPEKSSNVGSVLLSAFIGG